MAIGDRFNPLTSPSRDIIRPHLDGKLMQEIVKLRLSENLAEEIHRPVLEQLSTYARTGFGTIDPCLHLGWVFNRRPMPGQ
ncbi:hypothetical protein ACOSP7_006322 [Xanthoceras sorbifolium]